MIHQLTVQHSLFYCEVEQVDAFKQLYCKWIPVLPSIDITPLSELDTIAAIFNQWITVNSNTSRPIMKMSKYFSHSFSYYVLSLIDFDIDTQNFLEQEKHNPDSLFLFTYHTIRKLLQLLQQLLIEHQQEDILPKLKNRDFFMKEDPINPPSDYLERNYFKYSKEIAQYFAFEYKNNYRYKYCLSHAIKEATLSASNPIA